MSTYALSDLHGQYDLYKQIKEFLKPEDKVYFLGDAGDRGPQCFRTIKAIAEDPQFIYMKGNHEDVLVRAMKSFYSDCPDPWDLTLLSYNGGHPTFDEWLEEEKPEIWIPYLEKLPTYLEYESPNGFKVCLSHAGFTPGTAEEDRDYLWDRDHFSDEWDFDKFRDTYVVFGHTPTPTVDREVLLDDGKDDFGVYWIPDTNKGMIDNGAFFTGKCCLLDLDTFESHIFEIEGFKSW